MIVVKRNARQNGRNANAPSRNLLWYSRKGLSELKLEEVKEKPLRVRSFLPDIPLLALGCSELPDGRAGMDLAKVSDIIGFSGGVEMTVDVDADQQIHAAFGAKTRRLACKEAV